VYDWSIKCEGCSFMGFPSVSCQQDVKPLTSLKHCESPPGI